MFNNKYKILGCDAILYLHRKKEEDMSCFIDSKNLIKIRNSNFTWYAKWSKTAKCYYAVASKYLGVGKDGKSKSIPIYLSRYITNAPQKTHVDHIDFDTMNNREINLRISSVGNNAKNRSKINSNNTSGYRNVSWINGYWRIQLQIDNKNYLFPEKFYFDDIDLAGDFARKMRELYYKEFKGAD